MAQNLKKAIILHTVGVLRSLGSRPSRKNVTFRGSHCSIELKITFQSGSPSSSCGDPQLRPLVLGLGFRVQQKGPEGGQYAGGLGRLRI